jgi:hypothetical protein
VPQSILQRTTPYLELDRTDDLGIFAQDQWKLNKFTFNYGLRFDYVNGYVPEQDIPGTPDPKFFDRFPGVPAVNSWVGTRTYAAVNGIPHWMDINPRGESLTTCSATAAMRSNRARSLCRQDQRRRRRAA